MSMWPNYVSRYPIFSMERLGGLLALHAADHYMLWVGELCGGPIGESLVGGSLPVGLSLERDRISLFYIRRGQIYLFDVERACRLTA